MAEMRIESRFNPVTKKPQTMWLVSCSRCGQDGGIPKPLIKSFADGVEEKFFTNALRRDGWEVGSHLRKPVCPDCQKAAAARTATAKSKSIACDAGVEGLPMPSNVTTLPQTSAPVADPPRQPQPAQYRLIFGALEEAYDTKVGGYMKGFSDEKIAEKLNMPRAWVTKIRDEMFGPAIDAATAALQPELRTMMQAIKEAEVRQQKGADELAQLRHKVSTLAAKVGLLDLK